VRLSTINCSSAILPNPTKREVSSSTVEWVQCSKKRGENVSMIDDSRVESREGSKEGDKSPKCEEFRDERNVQGISRPYCTERGGMEPMTSMKSMFCNLK